MNVDQHRRDENAAAQAAHVSEHKKLMRLLVPYVEVSDHNFLLEDFLDAVATRLLKATREIRMERQERAFSSYPISPQVAETAVAQIEALRAAA